jgi:hypothetical protein
LDIINAIVADILDLTLKRINRYIKEVKRIYGGDSGSPPAGGPEL